jgi:hypothetical protein
MPEEVSHGDIYHKLGSLEGKVDALTGILSQKQADLSEAFRRLGDLEKRVAQGVILAVLIAVVAPLLWQAIDPRLQFGDPPASQAHER